MKIYKTQDEVDRDIKDGVLAIEGDVRFECAISINASIIVNGNINCGDINCRDIDCENIDCGDIDCGNINCGNINCRDINCRDINCENIDCGDIDCGNINCGDINCRDIDCGNINCGNINCGNIDCGNIDCRDINCGDILYYAFCCVYKSIFCFSIKSKRDIAQKPICLDGELKFKQKDDDVEKAIKLLTEKGKLKDGKILI